MDQLIKKIVSEHFITPSQNWCYRSFELLKDLGFNPVGVEGIKDFFTFYGLYHLWYEKGSGKEVYGYEPTTILPYRKRKAIDDEFERIVVLLKKDIVRELWECILLEFQYFLGNMDRGCDLRFLTYSDIRKYNICHITPHDIENYRMRKYSAHDTELNYSTYILCIEHGWDHTDVEKYFNEFYGFDYDSLERLRDDGLLNLRVIERLFMLKQVWSELYGGEEWAKACGVLDDLINSNGIKNDIFYLDRVFNLQHNTGSLFTKNDGRFSQISEIFLNRRAEFTRLEQFLPYCHTYAQKLIIANLDK